LRPNLIPTGVGLNIDHSPSHFEHRGYVHCAKTRSSWVVPVELIPVTHDGRLRKGAILRWF